MDERPQIDLEPRDFRPRPAKGEPLFAPGGKRRLLLFVGIAAALALYWLAYHFAIGQWVLAAWSAWDPFNVR